MQKKIAHKIFLILSAIILVSIGYFFKSVMEFVSPSPSSSFYHATFEIFEYPDKPVAVWPSCPSDSTYLKVTVRDIENRRILDSGMQIIWYPESGNSRVELLDKNGVPKSLSIHSLNK